MKQIDLSSHLLACVLSSARKTNVALAGLLITVAITAGLHKLVAKFPWRQRNWIYRSSIFCATSFLLGFMLRSNNLSSDWVIAIDFRKNKMINNNELIKCVFTTHSKENKLNLIWTIKEREQFLGSNINGLTLTFSSWQERDWNAPVLWFISLLTPCLVENRRNNWSRWFSISICCY